MRTEKFKDLLPLYLGQEFIHSASKDTLGHKLTLDSLLIIEDENDYDEIKLILRPLSDLTTEELVKNINISNNIFFERGKKYREEYADAAKIFFLIQLGFDMFELIENGYAVDKTKLLTDAK